MAITILRQQALSWRRPGRHFTMPGPYRRGWSWASRQDAGRAGSRAIGGI